MLSINPTTLTSTTSLLSIYPSGPLRKAEISPKEGNPSQDSEALIRKRSKGHRKAAEMPKPKATKTLYFP